MIFTELDARVARQIQLLCTVDEYRRVTIPANGYDRFSPYDGTEDYWQYIPKYLISRCPFCGFVYEVQIDTYQRYHIGTNSHFRSPIGYDGHRAEICDHYVVYATFLDRHRAYNTETEFRSSPDAPGVYSYLLPDDLLSTMVMHALPICEIEDEIFFPRYTLFLTVYFCEKPQVIFSRWRASELEAAAGDPEYYATFLSERPDKIHILDWVRQKRVKWLNLDDPALPLESEPVDAFPYLREPSVLNDAAGSLHFLRGYGGSIADPNTIRWQIGDIVIHHHDAKKQAYLLTVVGYMRDGLYKVRYLDPELAGRPGRIVTTDLKYLLDPRKFDIPLPSA